MGMYRVRQGWALVPFLWAGAALGQTTPGPSARPASETIGSWILACPAGPADPCTLRDSDWIWPPAGGMSAALEVQRRGNDLVPVVAVRGLSPAMMVGGIAAAKPTVTLGFDSAAAFLLTCGMGSGAIVCAPDPAVVRPIAAALPKARTVAVGVALALPGGIDTPPHDIVLTLNATPAALARLRAVGAAGETPPAYPGLDLWGLGSKIMHDLGFAGNGARGP